MHSIEEIRAEYARLDKLCGVDTSGIEIVLSHRGVRRLGSFRCPKQGSDVPLRITINGRLLTEEAQFWDTVRHEYAHAVVYLRHPGQRHGHDAVWKAVCHQVGCSPDRLAAHTEETSAALKAQAKYRVHCRSCGRDSYYLKAGKAVKLLRQGRERYIRCAFCGGGSFELFIQTPEK